MDRLIDSEVSRASQRARYSTHDMRCWIPHNPYLPNLSIDLPGAAAEERLVEEIVGQHALEAQRRLIRSALSVAVLG